MKKIILIGLLLPFWCFSQNVDKITTFDNKVYDVIIISETETEVEFQKISDKKIVKLNKKYIKEIKKFRPPLKSNVIIMKSDSLRDLKYMIKIAKFLNKLGYSFEKFDKDFYTIETKKRTNKEGDVISNITILIDDNEAYFRIFAHPSDKIGMGAISSGIGFSISKDNDYNRQGFFIENSLFINVWDNCSRVAFNEIMKITNNYVLNYGGTINFKTE